MATKREKEKDSTADIREAIEELNARCPRCTSLNTIEADKGKKRVCGSCGHIYDV